MSGREKNYMFFETSSESTTYNALGTRRKNTSHLVWRRMNRTFNQLGRGWFGLLSKGHFNTQPTQGVRK